MSDEPKIVPTITIPLADYNAAKDLIAHVMDCHSVLREVAPLVCVEVDDRALASIKDRYVHFMRDLNVRAYHTHVE